ncbi:MAG: hypothetical protein K2O27_00295, partial [Candidatus Amulumruptor sp.]|nr:hypothetical protein [Candidatus Amulumruptor sp.]
MKRISAIVALAAILTTAINASERPDTVITETRPDGVIVTTYYPDGTAPKSTQTATTVYYTNKSSVII